MAQTRRKTKHRGNAAGFVESRGRTGRKPTSEEKKGPITAAAVKQKSLDKRDQPPTWRGAFLKAMFAAVLFLIVVAVAFKAPNSVISIFPVVVVGYTLISYYTDKWMYDRRQKRKVREGKAQSR